MVERHPGRTACCVKEGVEEGPVGHRVGAIAHRLGFAVGAGNRTRVEMIAADNDGCLEFAATHHFVEGEAKPVAVTQAYPANPGGQALELDPLTRQVEPIMEVKIIGQQFFDLGIRPVNILWITRKRCPAERPNAATEQRPDIGRHKSGEGKGIGNALILCNLTDVVAIVERRHPGPPKIEHRPDVGGHRRARRFFNRGRISLPCHLPLIKAPAERQITIDRIMRRCLIRHRVGPHPAPVYFGKDFSRIAEQANRNRRFGLGHNAQRLIEAVGLAIKIAGLQPHLDPAWLALNRKARRPRHCCGERLRPAHPAKTSGEYPFARKIAAIMLPPHFDESFVSALNNPLRADVDPRSRRHLAVHHQPRLIEFMEMIPCRPRGHEVRIGDQDARRILMRLKHADGLARLNEQCLIILKPAQRRDNRIEASPVTRRPANPAVDDKLLRILGHFGIEIVHQHPKRCFSQPAFGTNLRAAWGTDDAAVIDTGHASVLGEVKAGSNNVAQHRMQQFGALCVPTRWPFARFIKIAAHCEFHLDCMNAPLWCAIMSRDPAALEAPVDDLGVAARGTHGLCQCRRTGLAFKTADVELHQFSGKQARDAAQDRMRVIQYNFRVAGAQSFNLGVKCCVIGIEIGRPSPCDFGFTGFTAFMVERRAVEPFGRTQPRRRLPRIKRHARWIAVNINHRARNRGSDDRHPLLGCKLIEPFNIEISVTNCQFAVT